MAPRGFNYIKNQPEHQYCTGAIIELMSRVLFRVGFIAVLIFSFILASWFVIHGDVEFSADIARDFHLLRELDEKKIVLIGPRSSTGLFHGPLWTYVNYPAFLVGNGNPIAVGWGWVALASAFIASCFFIARDLFGKSTAYIFTIMTAIYAAYHAHAMYNPHGAMFLIPAFFYLFVKYVRTDKPIYLVSNIILGALITQFQMALGIPLIVLSLFYFTYHCFKKKNFKHLGFFLILPILLSNFIVFDLRHNHILLMKLTDFVGTKSEGQAYNYLPLVKDRINVMLTGVEIIRTDRLGYLNFIMLAITFFLIYVQIKDKKNRDIYFAFLYFYFGFYAVSFINKGPILYFYTFPVFPLVFLIFSSLITSRYKNFFVILLGVILVLNIRSGIGDIATSKSIIGNSIYSWKFLNGISQKVFQEDAQEFGYFVYAPDAFAYPAKYALMYESKQHNKNASYFTKKAITYVIAEPPPLNNPHMKSDWWIINQVNIKAKPAATTVFPNGYEIRKYNLTSEEISVPFDPAIDPGLNFR